MAEKTDGDRLTGAEKDIEYLKEFYKQTVEVSKQYLEVQTNNNGLLISINAKLDQGIKDKTDTDGKIAAHEERLEKVELAQRDLKLIVKILSAISGGIIALFVWAVDLYFSIKRAG